MIKVFYSSKKRILLSICSILLIIGALILIVSNHNKSNTYYETLTISKGDVKTLVSTSGKLKAVVTVDVGSQITGQISELFADFNTIVKKDQLLARIDPRSFESQVRQSEANLAVAKANLQMQIANKERAKSELESAFANLENRRATSNESKRVYQRNKELRNKGVVSNTQLSQSKTQFESAAAQMRSAKASYEATLANQKFVAAQVLNAKAQIHQKEALLEQSIIQLQHTDIRAPVDGIIIDRKIDLGQTVAASLNTPILFTIAQDTKNMQVETNVDEADIGQIKKNQTVSFTVDAFPQKTFSGKVVQIRQAPKTLQNVVTYGVIVSVKNNDQILLPGMTATVEIIVNEIKDAILIPYQALRYNHTLNRKSKRKKQEEYKEKRKKVVKNLIKNLKLNDDQIKQIKLFFIEQNKSIASIKKMMGPTEDKKQELIKGERKKFENKLISILGPEQINKYKKINNKFKINKDQYKSGKIWVLENDKQINEINIIYDESDSNFAILKSSNLISGVKVIVKRK